MPRIRTALTAAMLMAAMASPVLAQPPTPDPGRAPGAHAHAGKQPQPARLSVSGQGQASAPPDMAQITVGVSTQAETAQEAMAQNASRQKAVIEALKADGIEARDIQTSGLSLSPRMEYAENQAPKLVGYAVQNTISLRVRKLDGLGAVLDKLVATGANEVNGISFGRDDMVEAQDEARTEAVRDARRKAERMAAAADMRLGALRALSDSPVVEGPRPMMAMAADARMAEHTPIEAGELNVTAQVTAVFDLLPAHPEPAAGKPEDGAPPPSPAPAN
ncbi:MAG: SIMPL domain-containing protein [Paracoccus sp. (in: a-proteobacteria)]|uniref:SIMPL domain-containing protein n=1 Tax=Paracoccus sp. TaxID=267 RepID=UPI0039E6A3F2